MTGGRQVRSPWKPAFAYMPNRLNANELRVLGCLVEKELTTPDHYPLTLNSLIAACNQKTNREPVTSLSENEVSEALDSLRERNLVYVFFGASGRVPKYKHLFPRFYDLEPGEVAVMTVLMLRGPQTAGEINQRTTRLYGFASISEVHEAIEGLLHKDEPLLRTTSRRPGQKEARFAHLLEEGGEEDDRDPAPTAEPRPGIGERVDRLESEISALREEIDELVRRFREIEDRRR